MDDLRGQNQLPNYFQKGVNVLLVLRIPFLDKRGTNWYNTFICYVSHTYIEKKTDSTKFGCPRRLKSASKLVLKRMTMPALRFSMNLYLWYTEGQRCTSAWTCICYTKYASVALQLGTCIVCNEVNVSIALYRWLVYKLPAKVQCWHSLHYKL